MDNKPNEEKSVVNEQTEAVVDAPKSFADRIKEAYAEYNPQSEFDDDDQAFVALLEDYKKGKLSQKEMEEANAKIYEMIGDNPVLSDLLAKIAQGVPFEVALAEVVNLEELMPQEGEPNFEKYQQAVEARRARVSEIQGRKEKLDANQEQSKVTVEKFFAENGVEEEEQSRFVEFVDEGVQGLFEGRVGEDFLRRMYQAFRYDEDVVAAKEQGEIEGRNANIETKRTSKGATDGIPDSGGGVVAQEPKSERKAVFAGL